MKRQNRTIVVPFANEKEYLLMLPKKKSLRTHLEKQAQSYPELFPPAFEQGFWFCGFYRSKKLGLDFRYVRLKATGETYLLHPPFVMAYLVGRTKELSFPLRLRQWGVPFGAITEQFGRNDMFWYRAYISLGRNNIVGTTAKSEEALPEHLIADEKHIKQYKQKLYAATTVAKGCFLGVALAERADEKELTKAYGECLKEFEEVAPKHRIKTILADGWEATQKALRVLCKGVCVILCFFHAFLSVRKKCRKGEPLFEEAKARVWEVYRAPSFQSFSQKIRRLREWSTKHMPQSEAKQKMLGLCDKKDQFAGFYEHEGAYRTSNGLDRLMDYQDRQLYSMRHLNGELESSRLQLRAMALLWNFHPYETKTQKRKGVRSPFEELNGFQYHDDWLYNLRIASSLRGTRTLHEIS